jgi:hypothetical protein
MTDDATVVRDPDAVTPGWLTEVLRADGLLSRGIVTAVHPTPIGAGLMGQCTRIVLEVDDPDDVTPAALVVKGAATDPQVRAFMAHTGYRAEVCFYRHFARDLPVRAPRCSHAAIDDDGWFTLVLEDLSPAEPGDQLVGCKVAQVERAVLELVGLHAPRWGDPSLATHPCITRPATDVDLIAAGLAATVPGFVERYRAALDDAAVDFFERLGAGAAGWYRARPKPTTLIHSDYRPDNLLFGTTAGGPEVAVVDWQGLTHGAGVADVAFLVGNALTVDDRRHHEERLVRSYHHALVAAGVGGYSWDDCWREYRASLLSGLLTTVFGSMYGVRTERGDRMFELMAQRHATQALDLGADTLLDPR